MNRTRSTFYVVEKTQCDVYDVRCVCRPMSQSVISHLID